jgi:ABC-type phosphate transport system permease subunit
VYRAYAIALLWFLTPFTLMVFVSALFIFAVPIGFCIAVVIVTGAMERQVEARVRYDERDRPLTEEEPPWETQ